MSWELAAVSICAMASLTTAFVFALPFVRVRTDAEKRIHALEAANATLSDRVARCEQYAEARSMPRGLQVSR